MTADLTQLGRDARPAASPEDAVLETVPFARRTDPAAVVRFTCPEFTSLCPVTGQPDFAHLVIDYVPRTLTAEQAEGLDALRRQVESQLELRRNLAELESALAARDRAEEMRTLAEGIKDEASRQTMLRIAADYERLAERAAERAKGGPSQAG